VVRGRLAGSGQHGREAWWWMGAQRGEGEGASERIGRRRRCGGQEQRATRMCKYGNGRPFQFQGEMSSDVV
jgi:hypothetical protein